MIIGIKISEAIFKKGAYYSQDIDINFQTYCSSKNTRKDGACSRATGRCKCDQIAELGLNYLGKGLLA